MNEQEYLYLKDKLFDLIKLDIGAYKSHQMRRRLDSFIARYNSSSIMEYCRLLERDPEQLNKLQNFIPINVSEFFRDKSQFLQLKDYVLTELLKKNFKLNIWSAACSCGQEPYSIAMILKELSPNRKHRILATDIDGEALEKAKNGGPYPPSDIKNLDEQLLQRYFSRAKDGYWITKDIKNAVEFRQHDLIHAPFEQGFELIVCRNVLIYFSDEVKAKLYGKFQHSLKEEGVLFTGGTEIVLNARAFGFTNLYPFFYQKSPTQTEASMSTQVRI
ncbi:CheR family methyltransferase [Chloroflexota bacterium]